MGWGRRERQALAVHRLSSSRGLVKVLLVTLPLQNRAVIVGKGHREECFRVTDELVDVSLAGDLLHDPLLVVVA